MKLINPPCSLRSQEPAARVTGSEDAIAPIQRLLRDRRGANLVEYIILVGVVALLALGAFKSFGGDLKTKIGNQATTVQGINDTAEAAQP